VGAGVDCDLSSGWAGGVVVHFPALSDTSYLKLALDIVDHSVMIL
jgi:hypothetical protein